MAALTCLLIAIRCRERNVNETSIATVRSVDGCNDLQGMYGEFGIVGKRPSVERLDDLCDGAVHR